MQILPIFLQSLKQFLTLVMRFPLGGLLPAWKGVLLEVVTHLSPLLSTATEIWAKQISAAVAAEAQPSPASPAERDVGSLQFLYLGRYKV